ncbi:hypothetical protein [Gemmata sp.]|uniref:hypothetical protein n=1 Tax=Gemmata sp. TaxID=1914242 RepID=UPI003F710698
MTEGEWLACRTDSVRMLSRVPRAGNDRRFRLYAVALCRLVGFLIEDEGPEAEEALAVAELFADRAAPEEALALACRQLAASSPDRAAWFPVRLPCGHGAALRSIEYAAAVVMRGIAHHHPALDEYGDADAKRKAFNVKKTDILRDIFGNPFRPASFSPEWRTDTAVALARQIYESREFGAMPFLADALQDAGCDSDVILSHCRGPGPHVRGCWVVDLVLRGE